MKPLAAMRETKFEIVNVLCINRENINWFSNLLNACVPLTIHYDYDLFPRDYEFMWQMRTIDELQLKHGNLRQYEWFRVLKLMTTFILISSGGASSPRTKKTRQNVVYVYGNNESDIDCECVVRHTSIVSFVLCHGSMPASLLAHEFVMELCVFNFDDATILHASRVATNE